MIKELTAAEESQLRWLISARRHPERIEEFLAECGCSPAEIEEFFKQRTMRRSRLLADYRMKRNVRIVGVLIVLLATVPPFRASGGTIIGVSLGLLGIGVWMALTGSLTLHQS
jgi:hypothetical protein